jgi:heptose-I-phosphate ethanolaminephosphotransferase
MRTTVLSFLAAALFLWLPGLVNSVFTCLVYQWSWRQLGAGLFFPLLLALPVMFLGRQKLYLGIVYFLMIFPSLMDFVHLLLYRAPLRGEIYFALFEAPPTEISEFFLEQVTFAKLLVVLAYLAAPLFLLRLLHFERPRTRASHRLYLLPGVLLALLLLKWKGDLGFYNTHFNLLSSWQSFRKEKERFKEGIEERRSHTMKADVKSELPDSIAPVYVIVIGESTSRGHMSLFGYPRATNPSLEKIRNELVLFSRVTAPYTHTIPALRTILTFATRTDTAAFYTAPSLISIFRQAGFYTCWLSNQQPLGLFDTEVSVLAGEADHVQFVSDSLSAWSKPYDGSLLPLLENALRQKKKPCVIFLHLSGAHEYFSQRYPRADAFFRDTCGIRTPFQMDEEKIKVINDYDNAVRYGDHVLGEVIGLTRKYAPYSYVLYFPDHGEEVYDTSDRFSHSQWEPTPAMYDVPLILWTSPEFRACNPSRLSIMDRVKGMEYCTENIIHGILQLSRLQTPLCDTLNSLFSVKYNTALKNTPVK